MINSNGYTGSTAKHRGRMQVIASHWSWRRATVGVFVLPCCLIALAAVSTAHAAATKPVKLGAAGKYAIISETGITDVFASKIKGNVGVSPITGAADLLSCSEVTGKVYSVDNAGPAPCSIADPALLTVAVSDMKAAYTNAAGRAATVHELGSGNIGGMTLLPGVYGWSSSVSIPASITLKGSAKDVWILQVAQDVVMASATQVLLSGGALPQNVFWQVAGAVTIGTHAHFEGIVLSKTSISMQTGATINGRLLAQTAVSLQMNAVVQPKRN